MPDADGRWLLLIHNIPPKPGYLRMKAARQLANLGAVALKNSVYALPDGEGAREDFLWLGRQIEEGGGRAFVCAASFLGGLTDAEARGLFLADRDAAYRKLIVEFRAYLEALPAPQAGGERTGEAEEWLAKARRRFERVRQLDFFGAPARDAAEGMLTAVGRWLEAARSGEAGQDADIAHPEEYVGKVWVTRRGVHVDRIACAWLIRRFIDPQARFRFVGGASHAPDRGEVGFDMLDATFTHEGGACTFEVMARRFAPNDTALARLGEIVHDIDLKDERFGRPEAPGLAVLLEGTAMAGLGDEERLARGFALLDDVYAHLRAGGQEPKAWKGGSGGGGPL